MLVKASQDKPTPESIVGCPNCPFKTQQIGGRGPFDSPFVIVGESPGPTELPRGMPFSGPNNQMLDQVLLDAGFNSLGVQPYYTTALSCHPMDKTIPKMQHATGCCQGRLRAELQAHPRKVILCLGASAAWAVTGDYGLKITRDRGKVLKSEFASEGVVLAVHPAYLMRNGAGLPFWRKDIESAIQLFRGALQSVWTEPKWEVVENRKHLQTIVDAYVKTSFISADYETDGLNALFNRAIMLGITKDAGSLVHIIPEDVYYANLDLVKVLMEAPTPKWNWHNGKFDIQWAWASDPRLERIRRKLKVPVNKSLPKNVYRQLQHHEWAPAINARVDEDTMLMSYAMNENAGFHDLDQVAQCWIQAPAHKGVMDKYYKKPYGTLRFAPKEELYRYAAFDISKTHRMWKPMFEALSEDERLVKLYYNTLIPASHFFGRIERYGVNVDEAKVQANVLLEDDEIASIKAKLQKYAVAHMGREINFGSYIQLRELLYRYMRLGPPDSWKGDRWRAIPSDEDALVDIQRRTNHPIIHDLLEFREVSKRRGTYVINLIDHWKTDAKGKKSFVEGIVCPDGRVHPTFLIHGTTTGRPACRKPNILNQPRLDIIRNQYKAKKGKVYIEVDLNQAELRSLCQLSKDPLLTEIYRSNEISIHDTTTEAFFASVTAMEADEELMHRCADLLQYFGERTPKKVYKEAKMAGKTVNFGIVYGREAASIAQVFNVSHQEAQRWIDTWLGTYKVAGEYIMKCRRTVIRNQKMVTPWGRMKRVGVATPDKLRDLENQAANFPHQSIAHDILLESAMECEQRLLEEWNARPWNEVYDAIYLEVDADEEKICQIIDYITNVITEVPRRKGLTHIPFIGDAKIGPRWGTMKDWKGSFDATGFSWEDFEREWA